MKIKKNFFRIGKKRHYFIEFTDNNSIMLKEIKSILKIFFRQNVKIYFTGLFRANIPDSFKTVNFGTKSVYYTLDKIEQIDILLNEDFINNIVNLEFCLYFDNFISHSKPDIKNKIVNLYLENYFNDCGLLFDQTVFNETETFKSLKAIQKYY